MMWRIRPPVYSRVLANLRDEISFDTNAASALILSVANGDGAAPACCTLKSNTSRHVVSRSRDGMLNIV